MSFTIETGVPLPTRVGGRAGQSKYPFVTMQPGQMFWADPEAKTTTLRSAIGVFQTNNPGYGFAVRTVEGKVGVWCIKAPAEEVAPVEEDEDVDGEEEFEEGEEEYAEEE